VNIGGRTTNCSIRTGKDSFLTFGNELVVVTVHFKRHRI